MTFRPLRFLVLSLCTTTLFACSSTKTLEDQTGIQWETFEWTIADETYEGNPFDLVASASFTHSESGSSITTPIYFNGENAWKFRFTATETGEWKFTTTSTDTDLDGYSGAVTISENPDPKAHGFIKNFGNKWGWQGAEEAFVPQYLMAANMDYFYDFEKNVADENKIDAYIQEFMVEHGFTGFHFTVNARWFDIKGNWKEGALIDAENPDLRTYQVLETIIQKVHKMGGACHMWMWGADGKDDNRSGPGGIIGGHMNEIDQRNIKYLAARLGPLPGWSIGYGFDTENGWANVEQFESWKRMIEETSGWDHFIGARVGRDDKNWRGNAPEPMPPRPPLDEQNNAPIEDKWMAWLGGDYTGYTSYRPMYDRYREGMLHQPQKPSFEEDRFRLRNRANWVYKDYNELRTRRGLWNSTIAGGSANIWGNLLPDEYHGGSQPYQVDTINIKHQIKTYSVFWENRFRKEMESFKVGETMHLANPEQSLVVIYQEDTGKVPINLPKASGQLKAIAVDALKSYEEIDLGMISTKDFVWEAPYVSDWAIALGKF